MLAGIILPYDTFGTHLNSKSETIDEELEQENFHKAGETLAEVWNETVIDGHAVKAAEWRGGVRENEMEMPSQEWLAGHIRASQYCLQIVKCDNEECCAAPRSAIKNVLPDGFMPAPFAVTNIDGLKPADGDDPQCRFMSLFQRMSVNLLPGNSSMSKMPYDTCCPTVKNQITSRTCNICKMYFPSQLMVYDHKKAIHPRIKANAVPKTRPLRIAARRQRELMAIIASGTFYK